MFTEECYKCPIEFLMGVEYFQPNEVELKVELKVWSGTNVQVYHATSENGAA